ncbi:hypothetical protein LOC67_20575 [Stieleria sp. JC731]|uniref:hypothetical protein n=1 Tax=Pirellulaceae TaxID=2691357 RepID=UPI001E617998|nr:hypothetical protein [Stieleria sp. JC731]MCC9602952.1 hypothetical protein [Stieleria sp. JC731]
MVKSIEGPELNRRKAIGLVGSAIAKGAAASGVIAGLDFASGVRVLSADDKVTSKSAARSVNASTFNASIVNPLGRVPLSFIIDDSTCLVNMGHFCMPQFAEAWPDRQIYHQQWQQWPREIPDSFVRQFGEWCAEHSVKGKYSIVPYPACVGWVDRFIPGWSKKQLDDSVKLVRELMMPNWDIHPEMITHTRVIDLATGRPMESANSATMENSYPQTDVSVDYLASYLAYALRILKRCGLSCEGITTPGGFGNRVKAKLPIAVHQAVRDVFGSELPHYFKYVREGDESTIPSLEYADDTQSVDRLTVNVPAGTGDWFGSWEGNKKSDPDRYCNEDATSGRMVELIKRGEPAVMLCHWPGMYCNGDLSGFHAFQRVVESIHRRFADQTLWMKCSEIGRYYAAKELATLRLVDETTLQIDSPLACPALTIELNSSQQPIPTTFEGAGKTIKLTSCSKRSQLQPGSFHRDANKTLICLDIPKGTSEVRFISNE